MASEGYESPAERYCFRPFPFVPDRPTIYEIGGPGGWSQLVNAYPPGEENGPRSVGSRLGGETDPVATYRRLSEERDHSDSLLPFVDVDWVAVARDYDAVHLSIGGLSIGSLGSDPDRPWVEYACRLASVALGFPPVGGKFRPTSGRPGGRPAEPERMLTCCQIITLVGKPVQVRR